MKLAAVTRVTAAGTFVRLEGRADERGPCIVATAVGLVDVGDRVIVAELSAGRLVVVDTIADG